MKIKMYIDFYLIFLFLLLLSNLSFPQIDSPQSSKNKLSLNPRFSGFQVEVTSLLVVSELGGLVDIDFYSTPNNYHNIGARISLEYYDYLILNFGGGKESGGPFLDYNIFARHTIKGSVFWFSTLGGFSVHTTQYDRNPGTFLLFRIGFELKYNITEYEIGILLKGATSISEKSAGYLGLGFSLGFYSL